MNTPENIISKTPIRNVLLMQSVDSTNTHAKRLLSEPPEKPDFPLLILAEEQTAGRGRGAKKWWTGKGALAMSLVLSLGPDGAFQGISRDALPRLSLLTASAVAGLLEKTLLEKSLRKTVRVHPPNDVFLDEKKICGILIESPDSEHVIIGIGINTNNTLANLPEPFRELSRTITTLRDEIGEKIGEESFLIELLHSLFQAYRKLES